MSDKKILHVLNPDKFTIPFIHYINKEFNKSEHLYLCAFKPDTSELSTYPNVIYLKSRYRWNFCRNTFIVFRCFLNSSKIILHGNPILFYFFLFPFVLKKTYWVIYGYELIQNNLDSKNRLQFLIFDTIKKSVLRRIYAHITSIDSDSETANRLFKSKARIFISPFYLSNVVQIDKLNTSQNKHLKIMVGNSTSPSNHHEEIFMMLKEYKDLNAIIYCPLSYGIYYDYRDRIINLGKELFGEKFFPLTEFMEIEEYRKFLKTIDIAVFNHDRQEAMGVTLTLLSMGKVVYMRSGTNSFKALRELGIKIFDNKLITKKELFSPRDISGNPQLVYKNFNLETLKESLTTIFNY
jgi:dTDP-N-acetylfucosamine:lipid II N-acetylfucosaminyltransferase